MKTIKKGFVLLTMALLCTGVAVAQNSVAAQADQQFKDKQYTLAPFEEIYGGFSDYTLFFFQTLYDFYHEQFYSNPYYIIKIDQKLFLSNKLYNPQTYL